MIRKILEYPQDKDILTQKSELVDLEKDDYKTLIQDLKDTLHSTNNGVGISAIQIGEPKRICVIHYNGRDIALINPEITKTRGEQDSHEGCLSAPTVFGDFKRAQKVWCDYTNEDGRKKELADGGWCSILVQHELDHLDGWCKVFDLVEE